MGMELRESLGIWGLGEELAPGGDTAWGVTWERSTILPLFLHTVAQRDTDKHAHCHTVLLLLCIV